MPDKRTLADVLGEIYRTTNDERVKALATLVRDWQAERSVNRYLQMPVNTDDDVAQALRTLGVTDE